MALYEVTLRYIVEAKSASEAEHVWYYGSDPEGMEVTNVVELVKRGRG